MWLPASSWRNSGRLGKFVASCFWGATVALGVGALLFFAGLLIGTKIGERLTRLAFEAARKALTMHQQHMEIMVENNSRKAYKELLAALQRCKQEILSELGELQANTAHDLRDLKHAQKVELTHFWQAAKANLIRIGRKQERYQRIGRKRFTKGLRTKTQKALLLSQYDYGFARARSLLHRGIECIEQHDAKQRFYTFTRWLSQVQIADPQLNRLITNTTRRLSGIEDERIKAAEELAAQELAVCQQRIRVYRNRVAAALDDMKFKNRLQVEKGHQLIDRMMDKAREAGVKLQDPRPRNGAEVAAAHL